MAAHPARSDRPSDVVSLETIEAERRRSIDPRLRAETARKLRAGMALVASRPRGGTVDLLAAEGEERVAAEGGERTPASSMSLSGGDQSGANTSILEIQSVLDGVSTAEDQIQSVLDDLSTAAVLDGVSTAEDNISTADEAAPASGAAESHYETLCRINSIAARRSLEGQRSSSSLAPPGRRSFRNRLWGLFKSGREPEAKSNSDAEVKSPDAEVPTLGSTRHESPSFNLANRPGTPIPRSASPSFEFNRGRLARYPSGEPTPYSRGAETNSLETRGPETIRLGSLLTVESPASSPAPVRVDSPRPSAYGVPYPDIVRLDSPRPAPVHVDSPRPNFRQRWAARWTRNVLTWEDTSNRAQSPEAENPNPKAQSPSAHSPSASKSTVNCMICLEPATENSRNVDPCKHRYHEKCIGEWLRRGNSTCPLCRVRIVRRPGSGDFEDDHDISEYLQRLLTQHNVARPPPLVSSPNNYIDGFTSSPSPIRTPRPYRPGTPRPPGTPTREAHSGSPTFQPYPESPVDSLELYDIRPAWALGPGNMTRRPSVNTPQRLSNNPTLEIPEEKQDVLVIDNRPSSLPPPRANWEPRGVMLELGTDPIGPESSASPELITPRPRIQNLDLVVLDLDDFDRLDGHPVISSTLVDVELGPSPVSFRQAHKILRKQKRQEALAGFWTLDELEISRLLWLPVWPVSFGVGLVATLVWSLLVVPTLVILGSFGLCCHVCDADVRKIDPAVKRKKTWCLVLGSPIWIPLFILGYTLFALSTWFRFVFGVLTLRADATNVMPETVSAPWLNAGLISDDLFELD